MYYSKSSSPSISVPRNYSGNTFRVIDESERRYIKEDKTVLAVSEAKTELEKNGEISAKKEPPSSALSSLLSDVSLEDVLLLGLMLIIHQENPNDTTLLLLLILLLAK